MHPSVSSIGALQIGRDQLEPDVHDALAAFILDMEGLDPGLIGTLLSSLPGIGLFTQARLYIQVREFWLTSIYFPTNSVPTSQVLPWNLIFMINLNSARIMASQTP